MLARDNPFRVERVHALAFHYPAGLDAEALLDRFATLGHRGALVGPEGHGKSLLLDELGARLAARGMRIRRERLDFRQRRLRPPQLAALLDGLGAKDLILLDSADQLGPLGWRQLRRATRPAGGFLLTAHREGRLPTLLRCETSPDLLLQLVAELHPPTAEHLAPDLERFYQRHGGNLRTALRELYDFCAAG